jgi:FlaA1/EpsC-like NDP-sugar epimerase
MSNWTKNKFNEIEPGESQWKDLYKIAGVAALLMVALIPLQIIAYTLWGTPETASECFALFQESKLYGLLTLELPYLVSNILSVPLYIALFIALRRVNRSIVAIAAVLGLISAGIIFAARPTFDMLYLSNQYAAADSEAQRSIILGAGEAKIALMYGTAQQAHYILGSLALLLISIIMLRSDIFGKRIAYCGVIANVLVFGLFIPTIGLYLSILSVFPFLTLWLVLTGLRFLKLARIDNRDARISAGVIPETQIT